MSGLVLKVQLVAIAAEMAPLKSRVESSRPMVERALVAVFGA